MPLIRKANEEFLNQSSQLGGNESLLDRFTYEIVVNDRDQLILNTISFVDFVIIVLGTMGNLTSFYLLTRKRLRTVSSMRYLAALTLVDTACLYGWYLSSVYRQLNGDQHLKRIENLSPLLCKLISYMSFCSLQISSVLLCVLTVDRLLIIVSNVWRTKYANPQIANKIIAVVVVVVCVLNFMIPVRLGNQGIVKYNIKHLISQKSAVLTTTTPNPDEVDFLFNKINEPSYQPNMVLKFDKEYNEQVLIVQNFTMYHCYDDNDILLTVWNKIHLCIYSLIPFPVLFVLNLIVIRMTRDAAKSASKIANYASLAKFRTGQQFVTRLLLFLTLSFVLSTLPSTIAYAFWHKQIVQYSHGRILLNLLNTLQFFRHSANWIIYVYSSSFMREELTKCLMCKDTEYEQAQAMLGNQRPSVAIQFLRQIEHHMNVNNLDEIMDSNTMSHNTTNAGFGKLNQVALQDMIANDPDMYYHVLYYYGKSLGVNNNAQNGFKKESEDNNEDSDSNDEMRIDQHGENNNL